MNEPAHLVICMRISDFPLPGAISSPRECARCGHRVWLADSTPMDASAVIWCNRCFVEAQENGAEMNILPPTPRQAEEISSYFEFKKRYPHG